MLRYYYDVPQQALLTVSCVANCVTVLKKLCNKQNEKALETVVFPRLFVVELPRLELVDSTTPRRQGSAHFSPFYAVLYHLVTIGKTHENTNKNHVVTICTTT